MRPAMAGATGGGDRRAAYGAAEFGSRFVSNDGGIGREASTVGAAGAPAVKPAQIRAHLHSGRVRTRMGAVHLRPVQRAVAGSRGERTLPVEIAPLAGLRGRTESLLQRRDVIRHAPAMHRIVLPYGRRSPR